MKTVVFKIIRCFRSVSKWEIQVSRQDIRMRPCSSQYKDEIRLARRIFSCAYPQYYHDRDVLYLRGVNFEGDTALITSCDDPLQNVFNNILLSPFLIETERLSL